MNGFLIALAYWVGGNVSDGREEILLTHDGFIARQVQELREDPRLASKC